MSTLRWETKHRYYSAKIYRDLFGHWIVAVAHGGKHNNVGKVVTQPVESESAGIKRLAAISVKRVKRKYQQV